MLLANIFLVLSLARVPRYKWNPIYFRSTAVSNAALLKSLGLPDILSSVLVPPSKHTSHPSVASPADTILKLLGSLSAALAQIFAFVNFVQARRRFRAEGVDSDYGPALWMGLGAFLAAFLA